MYSFICGFNGRFLLYNNEDDVFVYSTDCLYGYIQIGLVNFDILNEIDSLCNKNYEVINYFLSCVTRTGVDLDKSIISMPYCEFIDNLSKFGKYVTFPDNYLKYKSICGKANKIAKFRGITLSEYINCLVKSIKCPKYKRDLRIWEREFSCDSDLVPINKMVEKLILKDEYELRPKMESDEYIRNNFLNSNTLDDFIISRSKLSKSRIIMKDKEFHSTLIIYQLPSLLSKDELSAKVSRFRKLFIKDALLYVEEYLKQMGYLQEEDNNLLEVNAIVMSYSTHELRLNVSLRHELLELKETYEKEDSYDVI